MSAEKKHRTDQAVNPTSPQKQEKFDLQNLKNDLEYRSFLHHFQQAEFHICADILDSLDQRYPGHPILAEFRDELEIKTSARSTTDYFEQEKKRENKKSASRLTITAILSALILLITFFFSYNYFSAAAEANRLAAEQSQLNQLYQQADQLLLSGKPGPAAEIVDRISLIDPGFDNLTTLFSRIELLQALETEYQQAIKLAEENDFLQALDLFMKIDAVQPALWDVSAQIAQMEKNIRIAELLEEGDEAYQRSNWSVVIFAYEEALSLNPDLDNPLIREQLLTSYLNRIINLLEDESATIEEIEQAERYYRKSIILIPQSREFSTERLYLQEVSSNLLETKFTQLGKAGLADPNQTRGSIAAAAGYIRKAAGINPNNTALQLDFKNAELYHIGFQQFNEQNWAMAITNLSQIVLVDPGFADGNARSLLYEAYYTHGKQYFSAGFFMDALSLFEQAELLAWEDQDNLMRLFQIQIMLGDTLGKLDVYDDAVSYYQFALEAVGVIPRLSDHPNLREVLIEADNLAALEQYQEAYLAYKEFFLSVNLIYTMYEAEIQDGANVALFASENLSTMDAVLKANDLPRNMVIRIGTILKVPIFD